MNDESAGGRIFFSSTGRSLVDEDEIVVLSVGVDIGSSTSHLVFSRIVLERLDSRYVVTTRETFYESDILLTPYSAEETIDADALGAFIERQYKDAKVDPDEIDTGALILTGVAVRRRNARKIGELFARQAGKMVAVSAGDNLETVMAAYGSGAVARSIRDRTTVMNVDVGGGTSKISICSEGRVVDLTAIDVGARLVCLDATGRIVRHRGGRPPLRAASSGSSSSSATRSRREAARALAARMADRLMDAMAGGSPTAAGHGLLRLDPLAARGPVDQITFSGGVSEYIYGREAADVRRSRRAPGAGDPRPARRLARPARALDRRHPRHRHRGLAIHHPGERQHHLRVAHGGAAAAQRAGDRAGAWRSRTRRSIRPRSRPPIKGVLKRLDLGEGDTPVAVFVPWRGSATFRRLDDFCSGAIAGLADILAKGHPLVLVGDGDVGGLLGVHLHEEMRVTNAIVSVDGLELKEFDYIDIGTMLPTSGAVPVVIKSLIFPTSAAPGKEWQPAPRALGAPATFGLSRHDGPLPRHGRYRRHVLGFRLSQRGDPRGLHQQGALDPRRPVAGHPAGRRDAARQGRRGRRHRVFLPRHHRRHQRAPGRQGRQDRPPGDGRLSRHLSGGRAGAPLRGRNLRRDVRQAGAAGAAEPHRRGEGARRSSGPGAARARRGGAAGNLAGARPARDSNRSRCASCSRFSILRTKSGWHRSRARSCPIAASRSPARSCR